MPATHAAAAEAAAPTAREPLPREAVRALFFVTGVAEPGLLPRLIEPFAKLGHVPSRVHASREAGDGSELVVELRLAGVLPHAAAQVERALRAVIGVRQVMAVMEPC